MPESPNKRVYVDSNVLIYAVEGVPATAGPAKKLITFLRVNRNLTFTSEFTLAEVLAPPKARGAWPLHIKRRVYLDLLIFSGAITLIPVTRDILIGTADLRKTTSLKLPDAIHLMSAIRSDCKFMVSGDADFKRLPSGMIQVRPDDVGIDKLLRNLA
jgi:predicted nucleic acid-binding protein